LAHRYHTSFAEADYNRDEQSLEVSLRTFADDLENILSRRAGKRIALDRRKEAEPLLLAYLQETFQLKSSSGGVLKLSWVGMEVKVDAVWLYFEVKIPGGLNDVQLRNRFLQDLFNDQRNVVNVKDGEQKTAMTFVRGEEFKAVSSRRPVAFR
jgi:hypothetical protein